MAAKLGTLTLDLIAKIGGFTGPMDKASKKTKQFSDDAKKYGKAAGAAIGAAGVAAAAGIALIVNAQRDLIDQQAKAAQMLDTTYASMANLKRAGELGGVGMEKISAAGRQLNLNIGKAIQGTDLQVEAFARLGLSAQKIYDLPLDQRIATINQALRDNVQASERAAVAADIFGAKNAKAIQQLDPATIAEAARQVELFGLNLSDVDVAKVELANDAFSTFGLLSDGIAKQLTVELAPILKAVADEFLNAAEEAGGLGTVVQETTRDVVRAMAFVADAGDGVGRVFSTVATTLVGMYATAVGDVNALSAAVARGLSKLPDFAGGAGFARQTEQYGQAAANSYSVAEQALQKLRDNLETPLAGQALLAAYDSAQAAAESAAVATIAGRKEVAESGDAFVAVETKKVAAARKTVDAIGNQIRALELQVETLGMSSDEATLFKLALDGATDSQLRQADAALQSVAAYEAQTKALEAAKDAQADINKEALSIIESLQSEEESIQKSYERRRQIILDNTIATGEAQTEALRKLEEKRNEDLLAINGSYWENYLAAAEEALTSFDELAGSVVENFSAQFGNAFEAMVFDAQSLEDAVSGMAESMARSVINALGQMAAQWLAYQVVQMLVGKTTQASAAATMIANATATAGQASLAAFASTAAIPIIGPAAAPGAAAIAAGLTAPMVAGISTAALSGMAHDGIDSVPQTGTWLLEKGERVTTANTSAALDKTLADIQSGQRGTGGSAPNITINMPPMKDQRENREATAHTARRIGQVMRSAGRYN